MTNKKRGLRVEGTQVPPTGDAWSKKELFLLEPKTLVIVIITSVLTLLVSFFGQQGAKLLTSVLSPIPEHAPFDGTTAPIKQVPNWVKLTETERKAQYAALPSDKLIPLPAYNPTRLAIPVSSLKWNNPNDDAIRNEKITYSVPYLGSYRLDNLENVGSHPAVDIKIPEGTPIYAIANGTVTKVDNGNGGFGHHIVIQHNGVGTSDDPSKTATIFSSYSHMSTLSVPLHAVVTKGQLIGFSGQTGTATTPHLHFQIDNDTVPWHPYWPFTSADAKNAGYTFFEAINNGLKKDVAAASTLNPMAYVQKYANGTSLVATAAPTSATLSQPAAPTTDQYADTGFLIQLPKTSLAEKEELLLIVQAFDKSGTLLSNPTFEDAITFSSVNGNVSLNQDKMFASHLKTGIASVVKITGVKAGKDKVTLRFRDKEFSSPEFDVTATKKSPAGFFVLPDKLSIQIGETATVAVRAVDISGTPIADFEVDETPLITFTNSIGRVNIPQLTQSHFAGSEASVIFTAVEVGSTDVIVSYHMQTFRSPLITVTLPVEMPATPEALPPDATTVGSSTEAIIPVAPTEPVVSETLPVVVVPPVIAPEVPVVPAEPLPFTDVPVGSKYFEALTELKASGLVAGYADFTFKPDQAVSRAEAVTFILRATRENIREQIELAFPDVSKETWQYKFVGTAFDIGFVKGYPDGYFRPNNIVTVAEFFTMLFVAAKVDVDPDVLIALPEDMKPGDWFLPYLQEAIRKNIWQVKDNKVEPAKPLTRGEIADVLYRLRKLEQQSK